MNLTDHFFHQDTITVAKQLLGKILVHQSPEGITSGMIVETEAYLVDDPANHAYNGQTSRTLAMFGQPGTIYVYLSYGIHYCFNIVTGQEGVGEAVLIRALEPIEGIKLMKQRRNTTNKRLLCNGPGKLCQAMGINLSHNGQSLGKKLTISEGSHTKLTNEIITTSRIGVSKGKESLLRFLLSYTSDPS